MKAIRIIENRGVPLRRSDVDTDQIIPASWLKRVERTGFGRGLFSEWRDDVTFVLNNPAYQGATILLGGERFGTGSSREHAVWALMDYGFEAVVASSFGDIFANNASKQGLVTVQLPDADIAQLAHWCTEDPNTLVVIDVAARTIEAPAHHFHQSFALRDDVQQRLLAGLDDIGATLQHASRIAAFEAAHEPPTWRHDSFDNPARQK
jgi:3-isopropylmalate/(R)-2-methylmalate dehydratase small subunit